MMVYIGESVIVCLYIQKIIDKVYEIKRRENI